MKVFLGGTCNGSNWRSYVVNQLHNSIKFVNPISSWRNEDKEKENLEKSTCDYHLYVITPKLLGIYSIAEAVYQSCTKPDKTIFCVLDSDEGTEFVEYQSRSIIAVKKLIQSCGVPVFSSLDDVVSHLVKKKNSKKASIMV